MKYFIQIILITYINETKKNITTFLVLRTFICYLNSNRFSNNLTFKFKIAFSKIELEYCEKFPTYKINTSTILINFLK